MNLFQKTLALVKMIREDSENSPEFDKKSMKTQVATTGSAYARVAKAEQEKTPTKNKHILVYGAGLHHTTEGVAAGSGAKENGHTVHDYEPFPDRRKYAPTYTKDTDIKHKYDEVYCGNVHNVVKPDVAEHITKHILSTLKEGGVAHIGTRKTKGDVDGAKNKEPVEGNKDAFLIGKDKVYQEGYDYSKLESHIKDVAHKNGHDVHVARSSFCATGARVTLVKKAEEKKN